VDKSGNVYVAETQSHLPRKISPSGEVVTLAGQSGVEESANGEGFNATFNFPVGLSIDSVGHIFVAGYGNSTIRKI
jgi:hypothetical protein